MARLGCRESRSCAVTVAEHPGGMGCPGCVAVPLALEAAEIPSRLMLSLPNVHCAACIGKIEAGLNATPGVRSARVNLTLKRASVEAAAGITAADLVGVLAGLGHEAHELDATALSSTETDRQGRQLSMRLAVAGFAMMNVMLLSVAVWSGAGGALRDMFHWISLAIAVPTVAYAAQPFFRSAWASLRARQVGMDVPISVAILLATGISVFETTQGGPVAWFDAAVTLTFFLLAGRYLDHRTRAAARSAAAVLSALEVPRALRIGPGGTETVEVTDLRPDDLVLVRPGGRMPVDGIVTDGTSELDRAILTGETVPVFAGPGSRVSAGETNLTGPLTLRVTHAGRDSSLHRMADLVAVAEASRGRYTTLADRAARVYVPVVHLLSLGAFAVWWAATSDARLAINIAVAVLIITCPCGLGLAVPAVVTAASGWLFRRGMLIKTGTALERLAEATVVVFDKTGTLTLGVPEVAGLDGHNRRDLAVAFALADASSHPLARALAQAIKTFGVRPAHVTKVTEVPGYGIQGIWQGHQVQLGRADWLGIGQDETTATHLRVGTAPPVTFRFTDRLRPGAEAAVAGMKALGLRVMLMSGDAAIPVASLAKRLGIDSFEARLTPTDKAAQISALSAGGAKVLMIGDGLNDTAALAAAHVSIAPAQALDAARAASDIVLLGTDLAPLADAVRLSRVAVARMRQNFALSVAYNVIAVPIALLGFATPLISAIAMSLSSITVSLNAMRTR
ncbi:heavy metal translocating P-type ATPase [Tabrizicola sp.]|uniref:heavy metal translocating P-type ATPase n=1 Tax=Tabrizicola sp. TaxID=2005166 RepID=UPI003F341D93